VTFCETVKSLRRTAARAVRRGSVASAKINSYRSWLAGGRAGGRAVSREWPDRSAVVSSRWV